MKSSKLNTLELIVERDSRKQSLNLMRRDNKRKARLHYASIVCAVGILDETIDSSRLELFCYRCCGCELSRNITTIIFVSNRSFFLFKVFRITKASTDKSKHLRLMDKLIFK
ncbi:N6-adenosine-methyltransferase subunit [Sarcoptes scabiei]|nr:N6-adenosine-methyltransferase subunit [Sarcoptes scabiei]